MCIRRPGRSRWLVGWPLPRGGLCPAPERLGRRRSGSTPATIPRGHLRITKRLQRCIHVFREFDEEIGLQPILAQLTTWPQLLL
ncbi:DUF1931 family protein [Kribbella pittospori]|uniref:DUF1931 family protein n=1 Tax=Kribbella pittospori TaxID=722689 RepID=A0A4V2M881_9ACTN|nr:DUF1931 family protein [Kribbella pittospori]